MSRSQYILELVKTALQSDLRRVSDLIRGAARIARLRNDYVNLWWLEWEMVDIADKDAKMGAIDEFFAHLTKETFEFWHAKFGKMWINERAVEHFDEDNNVVNGKFFGLSIPEIENALEHCVKTGEQAISPPGLHSLDLYYQEQANAEVRRLASLQEKNCKNILSRVSNRVSKYLSDVEKQIIFGQIHADIFEENRLYVDRKLGEMCPEVLSKFIAAYQRAKENNPESWAQALTSCRRLLKSLADALYPPSDKLVRGLDGKERRLTDEMYISRLWQFVFERSRKTASGALLRTQLEDYGNRLDRLYELACKGVHSEVSRFELNQCLIQTYIIAGDLLRLHEDST